MTAGRFTLSVSAATLAELPDASGRAPAFSPVAACFSGMGAAWSSVPLACDGVSWDAAQANADKAAAAAAAIAKGVCWKFILMVCSAGRTPSNLIIQRVVIR